MDSSLPRRSGRRRARESSTAGPVNVSVLCPSSACGGEFAVAPERLGRSMRCPLCDVRMTARPAAVTEQLREQELRLAGAAGAAVERLPLAVLVDNVRSLWNVGSIFRTADACGVRQLVLTGITGVPPRDEIAKTALGAEQAVAWRYHAESMEALAVLRREGYAPVALETSPRSVPLDAFEWPDAPCLVIGNEVAGVGEAMLEACAHHVHIPMRGVKDSLNVAVAMGIAAHHASTALHGRLESNVSTGREASP